MCLVRDFAHDWGSQETSQFPKVACKHALPCVWDCGKE